MIPAFATDMNAKSAAIVTRTSPVVPAKDCHRGAQPEEDPERQVPLRILDLLRDAGDLGHAHVTDEDESRGREDARPTLVEESREPSGVDRERPLQHEPTEQGEERDHHHDLESRGRLRAQEVHAAEEQGERHRDSLDRRILEEERDVGPHADQRERRLHQKCEPAAETADRSRHGTEASIEEEVGSSGLRHRRRELHLADHRRHHHGGGDQVGDDDRRSRLLEGEPRKEEEPGAQRGAGRDG
jgi:hypothetical protein